MDEKEADGKAITMIEIIRGSKSQESRYAIATLAAMNLEQGFETMREAYAELPNADVMMEYLLGNLEAIQWLLDDLSGLNADGAQELAVTKPDTQK